MTRSGARSGASLVLAVLVCCCCISCSRAQEKVCTELREWTKTLGAQVDKVELQQGDDGLALTAATDIPADAVVLTIPAALLFPTSVDPSSPVMHMIENATIGRISAMCLYLIAEKKMSDSFWARWIRSLPTKFHHALSYSEEDMLHFQASPFKDLRKRKTHNVNQEYTNTILPLLAKLAPKPDAPAQAVIDAAVVAAATAAGKTAEEAAGAAVKARNLTAEDFSREDYEWAYSVITTRAIFPGLLTERERDGDVPLVVLGPLSDSMAHGEGLLKLSYDAEKQQCSFTALQPIKKGDHISVGVGMTSNLELLANRGALLARNPSNFVLMKFQLDSMSDMHYSAREAMMRHLNLSNPMTYVVRSGEMPQGLLASLRIQALTPVEFGVYQKALQTPVTLDNEWRAYRLLISSCNAILNLYATSLEEDNQLLQSAALSRATRSAILLRRQEKLIYASINDWANEAWNAILYAQTSPPATSGPQ